MSLNLHLEEPTKNGAKAELWQMRTAVAEHVMSVSGNADRVLAYFLWLEREVLFDSPGALLDHKVKVLMFMVRHPTARFQHL